MSVHTAWYAVMWWQRVVGWSTLTWSLFPSLRWSLKNLLCEKYYTYLQQRHRRHAVASPFRRGTGSQNSSISAVGFLFFVILMPALGLSSLSSSESSSTTTLSSIPFSSTEPSNKSVTEMARGKMGCVHTTFLPHTLCFIFLSFYTCCSLSHGFGLQKCEARAVGHRKPCGGFVGLSLTGLSLGWPAAFRPGRHITTAECWTWQCRAPCTHNLFCWWGLRWATELLEVRWRRRLIDHIHVGEWRWGS